MPERERNTLTAMLLIIFAAAVAVVGFTWWYTQGTTEPERYSQYGFAFEYPRNMELNTTGTSSSGRVIGFLSNDEIEFIKVEWQTAESTPNLQTLLNESFLSLEAEGLEVERAQPVNASEVYGHEMISQSFTGTVAKAITFYGFSGVWHCDTANRSFEFVVMHVEQDVLPKFQRYLDSFVCH